MIEQITKQLNKLVEVVKVVVLVDRQEMQGRENILKEVPDVESLITTEEIMKLYRRRDRCQSQ